MPAAFNKHDTTNNARRTRFLNLVVPALIDGGIWDLLPSVLGYMVHSVSCLYSNLRSPKAASI